MEGQELLFGFLVLITAFLYSSVGHGGASGYLALMAIFAFPPEAMKSTALIMNLFVAGIAFIVNYKAGNFKFYLLLPFIILSIPGAYIGAGIHISNKLYMLLLGVFLIIVSIRFIFLHPKEQTQIKTPKRFILIVIGALLGLLSGILGIGGGVILSPIIILMGWATIKQTTGIAAAFIFVNSFSALIGTHNQGFSVSPSIWVFVLISIVGAILGTYYSIQKFNSKTIVYILSIVLCSVGFKLIL